ncbi:hypothetical protein Lfu02_69750 [Longispora fulva]|uniref:Mini-circle protein n=1 Tax=Longispora fulva TaxID=619741 RepID=A0A8J7GET1_9ACTN|nr:DinB family protein [Longispora fulva]MBG6134483.1 hypothetical protein [Longispora fulva]GIG62603.1 hypothetical protein Lfu02_69750 [Longispora fulva]
MTWTSPHPDRVPPPEFADERATLHGFLDFHRDTLLRKCAGLTSEQLKLAPVPTSGLTLLGLVRHLAENERWWLRTCALGEDLPNLYCTTELPDGDFDLVADADAEADLEVFRLERLAVDQATAGRSLDHAFQAPGSSGTQMNLRWAYLHMLEEYARHNGHADLLREAIDGVTGE